ncbi:MAG: ArnT family glycosyltransferase [Gemmatimonadota bacterium]
MTDRPKLNVVLAVVAAGVMTAFFEWGGQIGLAPRSQAALLGLVGATALLLSWREFVRSGLLTPSVVGALLTCAIAAAAVLLPNSEGVTPGNRNERLLAAVGATASGWMLAAFFVGHSVPRPSVATWAPPRFGVPVLLCVSFLVLALTHFLAAGSYPVVSDEAVYFLQSDWIFNDRYGWCLPADLTPHFLMRKVGLSPAGCLFGMYAPGWPAVMALFDLAGLRWWSAVILGTTTVWATWRAGSLLFSQAAGFLAASLLAINPWFLLWHAGYMAHPLTICSIALAVVFLLRAEQLHGWPRIWRWLATGVAIAVAVTARPLTGMALGASLALWMLIRQRLSFRELSGCAALVIAGALPIAAWFLHYNWATTGDPLQLSYQAMFGSGYNLGFGTDKGFSGFNENLERVPLPVSFLPLDAVRSLLERLAGFNFSVLPLALAAPVVVLSAASGHKPRPVTLAAFLLLPFLYFFYWYSDLRFSSELVPLFMVWCAAGIVAIARTRSGLATSLVAAIVTSGVLLNVPVRGGRVPLDEPWLQSAYANSAQRVAMMRQLEELANDRGPLLVIVRERAPLIDALIDRPYIFNGPGLDSRILVVRDLGERNAAVLARFAERTPVLVTDRGVRTPPDVQILTR